MLRYGSETFKTLQRINSNPLWANESLPSNTYRLLRTNMVRRERAKKIHSNGTFIFMNCYHITEKGATELKEIETREAIRVHEERYFCF